MKAIIQLVLTRSVGWIFTIARKKTKKNIWDWFSDLLSKFCQLASTISPTKVVFYLNSRTSFRYDRLIHTDYCFRLLLASYETCPVRWSHLIHSFVCEFYYLIMHTCKISTTARTWHLTLWLLNSEI